VKFAGHPANLRSAHTQKNVVTGIFEEPAGDGRFTGIGMFAQRSGSFCVSY
jgi:hypothetical protein